MIESLNISNRGPLEAVDWAPKSGFNVIIGANDSGKMILLKALYAAVHSVEEPGRGDDARTFCRCWGMSSVGVVMPAAGSR